MKRFLSLAAICLAPAYAEAVILYGLDNTANQTDPGTGLPFASVGQLVGGSGVYLGNGYVLTANHVSLGSTITFDGATSYDIDYSFQPTQVAPNVDLKVFKLTTLPNVAGVNLFSGNIASQVLGKPSQSVGWGVGRDPATVPFSTAVPWGNDSTRAHRWGDVTLRFAQEISYDGYTEKSLILRASTASADSAALTVYDSGSGVFTNVDGTWHLTGIAVTVQTSGTSNFGNGTTTGDANFYVDVSAYRNQIMAIIPEPSTWAGLAGIFAGAVIWQTKRRQTRK